MCYFFIVAILFVLGIFFVDNSKKDVGSVLAVVILIVVGLISLIGFLGIFRR